MFTNQSTDLSLDASCRAVTAVRGERTENLWIAGTSNTGGSLSTHPQRPNTSTNQLQRLCFHADSNELTVEDRWDVGDDSAAVACLESSPTDPTLLLTAPEQGSSATLWKLPERNANNGTNSYYDDHDNDDEDNNYNSDAQQQQQSSSSQLEQVSSLLPEGGFGANIVDLAWRGAEGDQTTAATATTTAADVLTLDQNGHLTQWDLAAEASVRSVDTAIEPATSNNNNNYNNYNNYSGVPPPRVAWDPHSAGDSVAVTHGCAVRLLDWRVDATVPTGTAGMIRHAHRGGVTALDYNPNQPYCLATAGQDGVAKIWDLRQARHPLLTARGGHSHWISMLQYNPFHDQLVVTAGTDGVTNLWRLSTVSSAPLVLGGGGGGGHHHHHHHANTGGGAAASSSSTGGASDTAAPNVRVARHEGTESCYAAAWGAADAWIYLTVAYDGKVVLQHVPSKEKYKILL